MQQMIDKIAGLALYTVMVVVTFAFHFPLNEDLITAVDPARIENLAAVRDDFVTPWVAWSIVRTLPGFGPLGRGTCRAVSLRSGKHHRTTKQGTWAGWT